MKKLLFLLPLFFICCDSVDPDPPTQEDISSHYSIIIIDGCEYIQYSEYAGYQYGYKYSLTHKGNCKNH